ncbi:MAG: helix-turn-helix domain-containing protein [Treponema sp.]|nr:helix-turn-helix domain-containing protein [Treponema sp.]
MIVFFLAVAESLAARLVDKMKGYGHVAVLYSDIEDLCVAVTENRVGGLCLVAADYRIFGTQSRCPYETMAKILVKLKCPFVFYNDPFPEQDGLCDYWMKTLQEYSPGFFDEDIIRPVIRNLSECVVKEMALRNQETVEQTISSSELMEKIDERFKIPPSKKKLLSLLVEKQGACVESSDLCMSLWRNSEKRMSGRLHSYISWLRKNVLDEMTEPRTRILSDGNGTYLFMVSEV